MFFIFYTALFFEYCIACFFSVVYFISVLFIIPQIAGKL